MVSPYCEQNEHTPVDLISIVIEMVPRHLLQAKYV